MKNQFKNIALEGTCSGDVVGGLLSWAGENLQAFLFLRGAIMSFISEIEWKGATTFEEIDVWFCLSMLEFLKMFDEEFGMNQYGPEDTRAVFYYYEMRNKVEDLQKLLIRLYDEYRKNPLADAKDADTVKQALYVERKARAWIDKHRDFILKLSNREDCVEVMELFHKIIKQRNAESADNGQSHVAG